MRSWYPIPPKALDRQGLLGEHREVHAMWTILTSKKNSPYRNHPEVKRWQGHEDKLWWRHAALVEEMKRRGYKHSSPLEPRELALEILTRKDSGPVPLIEPLKVMRAKLAEKIRGRRD